jgi:outer membrane protein OmpA-like peptidoglycan-associated protein
VGYRNWRAGYGSPVRLAPLVGLAAAIALGAIVFLSMRADEPERLRPADVVLDPAASAGAPASAPTAGPSTSTGKPPATAAASTLAPATATSPPSSLGPTTTAAAVASTATPTTTTTTAPPTTPAAPALPAPAPFDTLPDGSPVPVVAIFDVSQITLTGAVPSQADVDALAALALANSKTPATVVNQLTINPSVPRNVGVRVIELTSSRFPEGSAVVELAHAAELNRVATVMNALPNTSVVVVGHADQRGDEVANYQLSDERARAVVNYLVGQGIAASRLASRAVGEADLLSLNDDAAALALNRRTEFLFYGLLQI